MEDFQAPITGPFSAPTDNFDGDGTDENVTDWFGSSDGILVDTTKITGEIDGTALFGDQGGEYAHGYEKLSLHDANGDGVVSGDELVGLALWIDDGDASLEAGELHSLARYAITSISTQMGVDARVGCDQLPSERTDRRYLRRISGSPLSDCRIHNHSGPSQLAFGPLLIWTECLCYFR